MNKIFFLLPLFLCFGNTQAQLILTQSNFYVSATHDTVYTVSPGLVNAPDPAATLWDYSNLPTNNSIYLMDTIPNSSFPTAQTAAQIFYALGPLQILDFLNRESTASGYVEIGSTTPQQMFSLETFTANPADNIVFPAQDYTYASPLVHLKFPASPATVWSSEVKKISNFTLTVTSSGLNNAPSQRRTNIKIDAEVAGWGQIIVPVAGGGVSMPYDVILVREHRTTQDSFWVNNMLAPTPLLNAFALSQGQTIHEYSSKFYYTGNERPFMEISHDSDSSYQNVNSCYFMRERVQPAVSVDAPWSLNALSIYPNPSSGSQIFLKIPENVHPESCIVLNEMGQNVFNTTIGSGSPLVSLNLPETLPSGIYHIRVSEKDSQKSFITNFVLTK